VKHILLCQGYKDGLTDVGYYKKMPRNERNGNYPGFSGCRKRYIGCLCSGGLNLLLLVGPKDGDHTIIDLSEEEIDRYKELGSYYESLSKNMDADNDGIPDILNTIYPQG
jgi:hypothetical protein